MAALLNCPSRSLGESTRAHARAQIHPNARLNNRWFVHRSGASLRSCLQFLLFPGCTTEFLLCVVHVDGCGRTYKEQHPSPGKLSSYVSLKYVLCLHQFGSTCCISSEELRLVMESSSSDHQITLRSKLDHCSLSKIVNYSCQSENRNLNLFQTSCEC